MKKTFVTLAAVAAVGLIAQTASAQCAFNSPSKAKGMKTDMVRAFVACPSSTLTVNADAGPGNTPACTPVTPYSTFNFNDKGKCAVKIGAKAEQPCKSDGTIDCTAVTVAPKCGGIVDASNSLTAGAGWKVNAVARATFNDRTDGDMTVIDFGASFDLNADKGKVSGKVSVNDFLVSVFGAQSQLPVCTTLELISLKLEDPNGALFATMGAVGLPK